MCNDNEVRKMNIFEHVEKTKHTILKEENLLGDSSFKIVFTEPKVALKLLRTLIPFLDKDPRKSLDEIMKNSVSTYKFYNVELKGVESSKRISSISMKPTEDFSGGGRRFYYDVLFDYKTGEKEKDLYTINFEMQQKDKEYDMLERALCYAMTLSDNILEKGDNYTKLHKVYSIWFLNFDYFDDEIAIHSIAPRVYYNMHRDVLTENISEQSIPAYSKNADLIEVVFIELKKRKYMRDAADLKEILDILCENTDKSKTLQVLCDLSEEEMKNMIGRKSFIDELTDEFTEKGMERGRQLEKIQMILKMSKNGIDVKTIAECASVSEEAVNNILQRQKEK